MTTWKKKGTTGRTIGEAMQWIIPERTYALLTLEVECGHSLPL
ncbi:hypothetical protein Tsp_13006, partial [Trichinella spiralis]